MDVDVSFIAAFLVGLLGGVHCVGMCGGIVGALCLGLQPAADKSSPQSTRVALPYLLSYNAGRITSYTLAGILMGGIGWLG
ncbi:MAG: sulfite exporter TauE/SafE family protein, partial [Gammaproteobacteria bacterium]|nr:sulfite exporter TauE/SafE family protein [Gammaproteobacteria bacterium]